LRQKPLDEGGFALAAARNEAQQVALREIGFRFQKQPPQKNILRGASFDRRSGCLLGVFVTGPGRDYRLTEGKIAAEDWG
jgi:hypothetical protein